MKYLNLEHSPQKTFSPQKNAETFFICKIGASFILFLKEQNETFFVSNIRLKSL